MVVEVLVDDDLDHAEREARVGAGAQLQVDVGVRGEPRDARLHADELATELHGVGHPVAHEEVGVGDGGVAAPDDGALGAHPLGVVVAQRRELREVGDEHAAVGHDHERQAGQVAGGAGQEAVLVGVRHAADLPLVVAGGAAQAVDGVAAVGHGDAAELLVAGFQRLVPRDALPLAASALAHAPHGVQDAVGMELHLLEGQAPGAQRAAVVRVVRVALALDELAGLLVGVHQHAAALVAARRAPHRGAGDHHAVLLVLEGFGVLPARIHLLPLAGAEVELVLLLGRADLVAVLLRDSVLYHRNSSRFARACRVSAPIGPPLWGCNRVKHAIGMSLSRNEYADWESVRWYDAVSRGDGKGVKDLHGGARWRPRPSPPWPDLPRTRERQR